MSKAASNEWEICALPYTPQGAKRIEEEWMGKKKTHALLQESDKHLNTTYKR